MAYIECKDCRYCEQEKYIGSTRSEFRQGDDYSYYCHKHGQHVIETDTCKDAEY